MSEKDFHPSQLSTEDAIAFALAKKQLQDMEERLISLEKDRDSALRWGLIVLGSSVVSMGLWIFKLLSSKIPV